MHLIRTIGAVNVAIGAVLFMFSFGMPELQLTAIYLTAVSAWLEGVSRNDTKD